MQPILSGKRDVFPNKNTHIISYEITNLSTCYFADTRPYYSTDDRHSNKNTDIFPNEYPDVFRNRNTYIISYESPSCNPCYFSAKNELKPMSNCLS
jgi:hypothetical protein